MSTTVVFVLISIINHFLSATPQTFPDEFMFGVGTSAYQIEGGWNASGKGENIWDHMTHNNPDAILDKSNGDIACDSYHKYKEDVALLKELGVQFYRFSLSWSRILPNGYANVINPDGIRYYNALIDELTKNGIKPMITLFHWDLPTPLQEIGGWVNPLLADIFVDYAEIAFAHFGDRVPYWITFNTDCRGYEKDRLAPAINQSGIADYMCGHVTIKAHAKTYRLYQKKFKKLQNGLVGIVARGVTWYQEKTDSQEDIDAAERARQFELGCYTYPILGDGDYPNVMKERISYRSSKEGFPRSRLPNFTALEKNYIRNTYDFLAINIYTANLVNNVPESNFNNVNYMNDIKVEFSIDPSWKNTSATWLKIVPDSIRNIVNWFKKQFNNPMIIISENGCADSEKFYDHTRAAFIEQYLSEILKAIHEDKVNIVAYSFWSLLDNFEWNDGYTQKFGLYRVDYEDPNRTRTPKLSAQLYKKIIATKRLN